MRFLAWILLFALQVNVSSQDLLWLDEQGEDYIDVHAAFRGTFHVPGGEKVEIRLSGASWYRVYLDGICFTEGPDRYAPEYPLYQERKTELKEGKHLIAVHMHSEGIATRMLQDIDPFLFCKVYSGGKELDIDWKARRLKGYEKQVRRVSPQFGWLEWVDTSQEPEPWTGPDYDDSSWKNARSVSRELGGFKASGITEVKNRPLVAETVAEGPLAGFYGYEKDNPSARFFLRDLECRDFPPQGIWKRYDLGKVRLTNPRFVLDLPGGTVVEFAFSEYLRHGRVMPWINLSGSDSYNLIHMEARGGKQEFFPLTPKGGRFVELHILADPDSIRFIKEEFMERGYHEAPDGAFNCGDPLLNRIWKLGAETYMSCAEDALVDNPTRERGQWMGDVGIVGLQIGAAAFSDLGIIKSGLRHFAQCAREDGMVAGLAPGAPAYLSTFAALWTNANIFYWQATGDIELLFELFPYAEKNIAAFEAQKTADGIGPEAGWAFVDWGYVPNEGRTDMGLNLIYYDALRAMVKWSLALDKTERAEYYEGLAGEMKQIIAAYYRPFLQPDRADWKGIGYHRTVLGLRNGFIPENMKKEAIASIRQHILDCFPNHPQAPRLSDPAANNPRLITPYFSHYAFPVLIENGEMDFVLDQIKTCWGWMLDQGSNTCLEVFDIRWSHCHQWAGCPTWQLSRYVLGLHPAFDRAPNSFDLKLIPGSLEQAGGEVPLPGGKQVKVSWERTARDISYTLECPEKITVNLPDPDHPDRKRKTVVRKKRTYTIPFAWTEKP